MRPGPTTSVLIVAGLALAAAGCGSTYSHDQLAWLGASSERPRGGPAMRIQWRQRLTEEDDGPYMPVERASAALDPDRNRIYIGSTAGELLALRPDGRRLFHYDAEGAIESAPALDRFQGELYFGTEEGVLHSIKAFDGELRWKERAGGPIRQTPVLTDDAVYLVTDDDMVVAFARDNGDSLWTYRRDLPEGFAITGHAGLVMADGRLVTGFTDGTVVALDPSDGRVIWELDTSLDVEPTEGSSPRFLDVDTTPVVADDTLYVASFAAGLYAVTLSGTVEWREPTLTGGTGLVHARGRLVVASADEGVVCLDLTTRSVVWRRGPSQGSPSPPAIVPEAGLVLVGESQGSLVALTLAAGQEVGRIDAGHGFSATASSALGLGFVLSNSGSLFAFRL